MKKQIFIFSVVFLFFVSCKKQADKEVIVIRDCTGTYLRYKGEDYKVINSQTVQQYNSEDRITATFRIEKKYKEEDKTICLMAHEMKDWIKVIEVQ